MTISGTENPMPAPNAKTSPARGDERPKQPDRSRSAAKRHDSDCERSADRRALLGFAARILGNWGHTARLLVLLVGVLAVVIVGLLLLHVELDLGSLHLGRR